MSNPVHDVGRTRFSPLPTFSSASFQSWHNRSSLLAPTPPAPPNDEERDVELSIHDPASFTSSRLAASFTGGLQGTSFSIGRNGAAAGEDGAPGSQRVLPSKDTELGGAELGGVGGEEYSSLYSRSEEGAAGELSYEEPKDTEPLRRFVTRSSSFTKEDFEALLQAPGMFAVKDDHLGGANRMMEVTAVVNGRVSQLLQQPAESRRPRRAREANLKSVFGLRTIRPDNPWYIIWSSLILLLDLSYSAFVVPISIGMMTSFFAANWTSILDYGAGALFCADLVVNFHVGFIATYNMHKVLVLNGKLIANFYMTKGSFASDLFSTTAWFGQIVLITLYYTLPNGFNPNTALYVMEGIRLMRFLRVIRLIKSLLQNCIYTALSVESKYLQFLKGQNFMYLSYIIYVILVMVNFIGCLWNFVAAITNFENSWVNFYPPFIRAVGDPALGQLTPEEAKHDVNDIWLYFAGCYWALTTITGVGYGDIVPVSLLETLVTLFVEIIGVMFFGLLLSTIGELLQQANRHARRVQTFRTKMQLVEQWMEQLALPKTLQRRIKTYYAEVWLRQTEIEVETQLFLELPHAIRNEVSWHVNHRIFRTVPMLSTLDDQDLYLIASKMVPCRFGPGTDLCSEGDAADRLWFLLEGEVAELHHHKLAEEIRGPAVLGETVMLQEAQQHFRLCPFTYRTVTNCSVWVLAWRDLKLLLAYRPELQQKLAVHVLRDLALHVRKHPDMWPPSIQEWGSLNLQQAISRPSSRVVDLAETQAVGGTALHAATAAGDQDEEVPCPAAPTEAMPSTTVEEGRGRLAGLKEAATHSTLARVAATSAAPAAAAASVAIGAAAALGAVALHLRPPAQQQQQEPPAQQQPGQPPEQQPAQQPGPPSYYSPAGLLDRPSPRPQSALRSESSSGSLLETVHEGVPLSPRERLRHFETMPAAVGRRIGQDLRVELEAMAGPAAQQQRGVQARAQGEDDVDLEAGSLPPGSPHQSGRFHVRAMLGRLRGRPPLPPSPPSGLTAADATVSGAAGKRLQAELQRELAAQRQQQQGQQGEQGEGEGGDGEGVEEGDAGHLRTGAAAAAGKTAAAAAAGAGPPAAEPPSEAQQQEQEQRSRLRETLHCTTMPAAMGRRLKPQLELELARGRREQQALAGIAGSGKVKPPLLRVSSLGLPLDTDGWAWKPGAEQGPPALAVQHPFDVAERKLAGRQRQRSLPARLEPAAPATATAQQGAMNEALAPLLQQMQAMAQGLQTLQQEVSLMRASFQVPAQQQPPR